MKRCVVSFTCMLQRGDRVGGKVKRCVVSCERFQELPGYITTVCNLYITKERQCRDGLVKRCLRISIRELFELSLDATRIKWKYMENKKHILTKWWVILLYSVYVHVIYVHFDLLSTRCDLVSDLSDMMWINSLILLLTGWFKVTRKYWRHISLLIHEQWCYPQVQHYLTRHTITLHNRNCRSS